jgi:hypothetical protein
MKFYQIFKKRVNMIIWEIKQLISLLVQVLHKINKDILKGIFIIIEENIMIQITFIIVGIQGNSTILVQTMDSMIKIIINFIINLDKMLICIMNFMKISKKSLMNNLWNTKNNN